MAPHPFLHEAGYGLLLVTFNPTDSASPILGNLSFVPVSPLPQVYICLTSSVHLFYLNSVSMLASFLATFPLFPWIRLPWPQDGERSFVWPSAQVYSAREIMQ